MESLHPPHFERFIFKIKLNCRVKTNAKFPETGSFLLNKVQKINETCHHPGYGIVLL
jgi:hypothetical protein